MPGAGFRAPGGRLPLVPGAWCREYYFVRQNNTLCYFVLQGNTVHYIVILTLHYWCRGPQEISVSGTVSHMLDFLLRSVLQNANFQSRKGVGPTMAIPQEIKPAANSGD